MDHAAFDTPESVNPPRVEANLRRLRALVEVFRCQSVNRAAERLHVTQSAVTRGMQALEDEVGLTLFTRSSRGMRPTEYGELLVRRTERALGYLEAAEREVLALVTEGDSRPPRTGLMHKLAQRHLQTLSAIADFRTETAAAQHLGVSQPAVTIALRDLEEIVDAPLFQRTSRGMVATPAGQALTRGAKLALNEIAAAGDDLAARLGLVGGRLVVGAQPLTGSQIAPQAVVRVAGQYPHLRVTMIEASHDVLTQGLRCGDIDVVVGGILPTPLPDITQEPLFEDRLVVVARRGHPLTQHAALTLDDLDGFEWVLPYRRTTHRNLVDRTIAQAGLRVPEGAIEANSVTLVRRLLTSSDRLSVLSHRHVQGVDGQDVLTTLPIELPEHGLAVGFLTRSDAIRTVGVETLIAHLRGSERVGHTA